jgi:hypothetical protein
MMLPRTQNQTAYSSTAKKSPIFKNPQPADAAKDNQGRTRLNAAEAAPPQALAFFLVTYVLVASFSEDAFSHVTTYFLHLMVAASLIPLLGA